MTEVDEFAIFIFLIRIQPQQPFLPVPGLQHEMMALGSRHSDEDRGAFQRRCWSIPFRHEAWIHRSSTPGTSVHSLHKPAFAGLMSSKSIPLGTL